MAASSFCFFPKLPYELRVEIWEAAVRPASPEKRGIHCFSVFDRHRARAMAARAQAALFPYGPSGRVHKAAIPSTHQGRPNRSAYLWDAGLWTACKESRRAIMAYLKKRRWQNPTTLGSVLHEPFFVTAPPLPQSNYSEHWQLMLHPCEDAIKFDHRAIMQILEWSEASLQYGRHYHILSGLSLYYHLPDARPMGNLVFEFDPSWMLALPPRSSSRPGQPSPFARLCEEHTPRGLVGRLLEAKARGLVRISTIWLIDRGATQCGPLVLGHGEHAVRRTQFYDCDDEFVDMGVPFGGDALSAALFVCWLASAATGQLSVDLWQSGQGDTFVVDKHVRVLGCKSKVRPSPVEWW